RPDPCIPPDARALEAGGLAGPPRRPPRADADGAFARWLPSQLSDVHRGQLEVEVDAVQEGAGQAPHVVLALGRRAHALLHGPAGAAAGIGGRDELEASGEGGAAGSARDRDLAFFQRLAQGLERPPREFWDLLEEE